MSGKWNSRLIELAEKVVVIGDVFVGKTSLLLRYKLNMFSDDVKSTLGYDSYEQEVSLSDGRTMKLWIWDTAGSERFRGTVSLYYKNAKAIIVVFDMTNRGSFDKVDFWKDEIDNYAEKETVRVLVGNKNDLVEQRTVMKEEAQALSKKLGFDFYIETSAKVESDPSVRKLFDTVAEKIKQRPVAEASAMSEKPSVSLKIPVKLKQEKLQTRKVAPAPKGCSC